MELPRAPGSVPGPAPAPAPAPARRDCTRFAPSITGEAHPGTLLAALLCWLDARSRGGRLVLRLEDLDTTRLRPGLSAAMIESLHWLGLDWDEVQHQHDLVEQHEAALDALAAAGRLYPCTCSRAERRDGRRAPDGGWAYPNTCRDRPLPDAGWREVPDALRVRLPDDRIELTDESGLDLSQNPALEMGDPIVRRRDGVLAYHLVVVCDDAASAVTRIVRGRDLAPSTATHVALQRLLGCQTPTYRHHLLFVERAGAGVSGKLAKMHGSVGYTALQAVYSPRDLCGIIAHAAGLLDRPLPCYPADLLADFDWHRVAVADQVLTWRDGTLSRG